MGKNEGYEITKSTLSGLIISRKFQIKLSYMTLIIVLLSMKQ